MSVFSRGRLKAVRLAAGLGVLAAFPFLSSGVAQAAMAGGNPLTTTNRADLRTVHVNDLAGTAEFCFDKPIANSTPQSGTLGSNADRFYLGGYRFDVSVAGFSANVESSNTNCAVATMLPAGTTGRDLTSYSFGSVADNTVIANAGGAGALGNIGDSTANLDSTSHNGTADHTQGPDLQSIAVDTTNNRIAYVFDQTINGTTVTPGNFGFYDGNGGYHLAQGLVGTSGSVVLMQFASPADSVSLAQDAVVVRGGIGGAANEGQPTGKNAICTSDTAPTAGFAVCDMTGDRQVGAPTESVAVPGTSGVTARPVLQTAALVPGPSNQIDFTFSLPVTQGTASDLVAVTSNGQEVQANTETVVSANTVRATFSGANMQNFQEEVVKAAAYGCSGTAGSPGPTCPTTDSGAVESVNPPAGAATRFNITGGVSVGDNAGAFATGFSTGPDAESVTFNTNGTVTVQMDQRVDNTGAGVKTTGCSGAANILNASGNLGGGCWVLLNNSGAVVDPVPASASVVNNAPFQSQVVLTYPPGDITGGGAVALAIAGPPVDCTGTNPNPPLTGQTAGTACSAAVTFGGSQGTSGMDPQGTVRQVLSPTASGSVFRLHFHSAAWYRAQARKHHKRRRHHKK